VVAGSGVDAQLIDHLKTVLAPVFEVDQHEVEGGAVVALEGVVITQRLGVFEDVGLDDLL